MTPQSTGGAGNGRCVRGRVLPVLPQSDVRRTSSAFRGVRRLGGGGASAAETPLRVRPAPRLARHVRQRTRLLGEPASRPAAAVAQHRSVEPSPRAAGALGSQPAARRPRDDDCQKRECTSPTRKLCYKTCGPINVGSSRRPAPVAYLEGECVFPAGVNYGCFQVPGAIQRRARLRPRSIISRALCRSVPCRAAACGAKCAECCRLSGLERRRQGRLLRLYRGATGGGKWSCASDTAWPCPGMKAADRGRARGLSRAAQRSTRHPEMVEFVSVTPLTRDSRSAWLTASSLLTRVRGYPERRGVNPIALPVNWELRAGSSGASPSRPGAFGRTSVRRGLDRGDQPWTVPTVPTCRLGMASMSSANRRSSCAVRLLRSSGGTGAAGAGPWRSPWHNPIPRAAAGFWPRSSHRPLQPGKPEGGPIRAAGDKVAPLRRNRRGQRWRSRRRGSASGGEPSASGGSADGALSSTAFRAALPPVV